LTYKQKWLFETYYKKNFAEELENRLFRA
jgi:hypothetical protein